MAADYRVANLIMVADYSKFWPIHVIGALDFARNVGYPIISERHQWQVLGFYRRSERDSMLDAFTDSNYLLGGTNHKGYTIQGLYGIAHNTWLGLRYMSYDHISGLPLAIDSVNLDLNARF